MLSNCSVAVIPGRCTWHHNSILYAICHYLSEFGNVGFKLYADLTGFKSSTELFNRLMPHIMLGRSDKLIVIEPALSAALKEIMCNHNCQQNFY